MEDIIEFVKIELERRRYAEKLKAEFDQEIKKVTFKTETQIPNILPTVTSEVVKSKIELKTNIPFEQKFLDSVVENVKSGKKQDSAQQISEKEKVELFSKVNKTLAQLTTSQRHAKELCDSLSEFKSHPFFDPCVVKGILDHGRIQVERHFESYSSYSFLICSFYTKLLFERFKLKLFTLVNKNLVGVYAIYFGVIKLKRDFNELKKFCDATINRMANNETGTVIETMLSVCKNILEAENENLYNEIIAKIRNILLPKVDDVCVKERIKSMIKK